MIVKYNLNWYPSVPAVSAVVSGSDTGGHGTMGLRSPVPVAVTMSSVRDICYQLLGHGMRKSGCFRKPQHRVVHKTFICFLDVAKKEVLFKGQKVCLYQFTFSI